MHYFIANQNGSGYQRFPGDQIAAVQAMPEAIRPVILTDEDEGVRQWILKDAREQARERVVSFANAIRTRIAKSHHYLQAAGWSVQIPAAKAIKEGTPTADDLQAMAREARLRKRGETVEQLADKVLFNAMVFSNVRSAVDGIETANLDAVSAYSGSDPAAFEEILNGAKAAALAEFLDIFGGVYGPAKAQAMAAQFFGAGG